MDKLAEGCFQMKYLCFLPCIQVMMVPIATINWCLDTFKEFQYKKVD